MKRYGYLWEDIVSWENMLLASRKARRGKRSKVSVVEFEFDLERNLLELQEELNSGTYRPGAFHSHWITRPKPRMISAAPYRDRVVHHSLMNVLEPILDRHFYAHSYACRKGKGTHAAANYLQKLMRRNRYLVKCDIQKFFPSIDLGILKGTFRRKIKDDRVLGLMDQIVDNSNPQEPAVQWFPGDTLLTPAFRRRGLPIGNLTSQWFANWMLDGLDHLLTSGFGLGGYVRYCDDFILLDNDRGKLKEAVDLAGIWLGEHRLKWHEERLGLQRTAQPVRFVGYRISPSRKKLPRENIRRFRRRLRWMKQQYATETINFKEIKQRINSWMGHARQADSEGLLWAMSRDWTFQRAMAGA